MQVYYCPSDRGFYTDEDHSDIPNDSLPISIDKWMALRQAQSTGKEVVILEDGTIGVEFPKVTLDSFRVNLKYRIKKWATDKEESMIDEYTAGEIASWPTQIEEAKLVVDCLVEDLPELDVPMLRAIAEARSIGLVALAEKVINKNIQFQQAAAVIYGQRQHYVDLMDSATSIAELEAITLA